MFTRNYKLCNKWQARNMFSLKLLKKKKYRDFKLTYVILLNAKRTINMIMLIHFIQVKVFIKMLSMNYYLTT